MNPVAWGKYVNERLLATTTREDIAHGREWSNPTYTVKPFYLHPPERVQDAERARDLYAAMRCTSVRR